MEGLMIMRFMRLSLVRVGSGMSIMATLELMSRWRMGVGFTRVRITARTRRALERRVLMDEFM